MARLQSIIKPASSPKLSNELTLRAAISLPESMYGIDLTQVETGSLREPRWIDPFQAPLSTETNAAAPNKMAAFRNIDSAKLASSGIDILEDVFVDCLRVASVE